ncbi:MAG: hypothetical protein AB8H79_05610 [Myxococcota bacterium]
MKNLRILPILCLVACPSRSPEVIIDPETPVTADDLQVSLDPPDPTATYQWSLDGITQADLASDRIVADLTTKGQRWSVIASSNGRALGSAEVSIGNTPPTATVSLPPKGTTGRDVVATAEGADADDETVIFRYAWTVDGQPVAGTDSVLPSSVPAPRGATVEVTVTPNDGEADGLPVSASTVMGNGIPSLTSAVISPQEPTENDVVTCAGQGWSDPDGDAAGYLTRWNVNNVEVSTEAELTGASFNKGDVITCFLTAWDGSIEGNEVMSDPVSVGNAPPVLESVVFDPEVFQVNDSVTAVPVGLADVDGDPVDVLWEWEIGEVVIEDYDDTIRLRKENAHQEVTVFATPTDGELQGSRVRLETVVANTAPTVSRVSIAGELYRGTKPTVGVIDAEDADGDSLTLSFSWSVNGAVVEKKRTCNLCDLKRGDSVRLEVTAEDGYGGATTNTTDRAVQNSKPTAPTVELDTSTGKLGSDFVCDIVAPATDADGDALTYTFAFTQGTSRKPYTGTTTTTNHPGDTVPSEAVKLGEQWECNFSVSDGIVTVGPGSETAKLTDCGPIPSTGFGGAKNAKALYEYNGRCFYLGDVGGTCDQTCASVGGGNWAFDGIAALSKSCKGPVSGQPAAYFFNNGNKGGWSSSNTSGHVARTMGHGNRSGEVYGACTGFSEVGAWPSTTNSVSNRSLVCACF